MKFYLNFLIPVLLGFLFSCSSGKQHFSFSAAAPVQVLKAEKITEASSSAALYPAAATSGNSALAFAGKTIPQPEPAKQNLQLRGPFLPSAQAKNASYNTSISEKQIQTPTSKKAKASVPKPDAKKVKLYGWLALAGGVLAFAPFVLGLSLLYAIPFAIAGMVFGRLALINRVGNYRQEGVAIAKAGFMMSIVVSVILFVFGIMVLVGA